MMIQSHIPVPSGLLHEAAGFPTLVRDWLHPEDGSSAATASWRACLDWTPSSDPAPAWLDTKWRSSWWTDFAADLPDDASRALARANVDRLVAGKADVIMTGQQPGFLGGPLYTLFKIATCIAAAAARTEGGKPTVPVFWMGDDDDDLREAFAPILFDPRRQVYLKPVTPDADASATVGGLPVRTAGVGEQGWLTERGPDDPFAGLLRDLWQTAQAEDWTWGRLHQRALSLLFREHGLLIVSGDDPALHAAAAPVYDVLFRERTTLADKAATHGRTLGDRGHHAQIGDDSLSRPFSVADGNRRLRLGAQDEPPTDTSRMRPGVLFRSPVQDWLFHPAGVVVGPGELSYLTQLETVYDALDLPRSPLLPRLFATLSPQALSETTKDATTDLSHEDRLSRLDTIAGQALAEAVGDAFGAPTPATEKQIRDVMARWSERNRALFTRLAATRTHASALPDWVTPGGRRQERTLAMYWALAIWGHGLLELSLDAAARHLESGRDGHWMEWTLIVDGTRCEGKTP